MGVVAMGEDREDDREPDAEKDPERERRRPPRGLPAVAALVLLAVCAVPARGEADRVTALSEALMRERPASGCGDACTRSGPIVVEGREDVVLRNLRVEGAQGDCVVVRASARVVLEGLSLAGCGGAGVRIENARAVVLRGLAVADTGQSGIVVDGSTDVRVEGGSIERSASGIYAHRSRGVVVRGTWLVDAQGPAPRGQGVQLDKVAGPGNEIACTVVVSRPGRAAPEDAINLFRSEGTPASPIRVAGNRILGGGPSPSGGGILVGDHGGGHVQVEGNVLVDPGQYGIGVAGGTHATVVDNIVVARARPFTNVGIYVWKAAEDGGPCGHHLLAGNRVAYARADGAANPLWVADTCAPTRADAALVEGPADLDPRLVLDEPALCAAIGRRDDPLNRH
ncbi:right-handed parallel beta-helix repeat-containing protein [Salinarimonas rosea]|uniref:right-handed parallel beta-helix repeat-containing protein n=1 Tax=Salinarimonas rosea TaxID=552063 RepID=UPI00048EF49F|nr:right-handed parallel beta-helix repeat-containing protein [Salinarimonas rosea]